MDDHARTKEELIEELQALRRRVAELERAPAAREAMEAEASKDEERRRQLAEDAERARLREEVQALQKTRAELQAILDCSPAIIYAKDTAGRYLLINRQFEQIFHVNGAAVVGKTDHDLFPLAMADAFRANDLAALHEARRSRSRRSPRGTAARAPTSRASSRSTTRRGARTPSAVSPPTSPSASATSRPCGSSPR